MAAIAIGGAVEARVAVATPNPDADLFRLTSAFKGAYSRHLDAWTTHHQWRDEVEALPDCPPPSSSDDSFMEFLDKHEDGRSWESMNQANDTMVEAAKAVFEVPARTLPGVLNKLRIVSIAVGDGLGDGDHDLAVNQEIGGPWIDVVIADLERLAREG
jgi:hypothetical protein